MLGEVSSSMEECRAETVALFRKSNCTMTMRFIVDPPQVASNLEILELFKVSDYSIIEIAVPTPISYSIVVHQQTRPRGYSIHYVPPHGSGWLTGTRVL